MRLLGIGLATLGLSFLVTGSSASTAAAAERAPSAGAEEQPDGSTSGGKLIVHEWGTFTSFSGSDGIRLEFRPLADEDLPPFVHDRFLQAGVLHPFSKSSVRVRLRMETPVTYFYTDRERDVNVRVRFPDGLLTEFYPPVAHMEPAFQFGEKPTLNSSMLDWGRIHLIPTDRLQAQVEDPDRRNLLESMLWKGLLPPSDPKYHYGHARETDSALLHVRRVRHDPKMQPLAPVGDFFEKFLFYRGVGNFELPLMLTAASDDRFEIANHGPDAIRSLILVEVNGKNVRFSVTPQVDTASSAQLSLPKEPSDINLLAEAVQQALIAEGLYEKEAAAMVQTWRSSWFGETGTRLLYIVPRPVTEALLPLEISPSPEETVRVLVGRMEIMTPEEESRVAAIVERSAAERHAAWEKAKSAGGHVKYAGPAEIKKLGRLAEPALVRIRSISQEPAVRTEAKQLLEQLGYGPLR